MKTKIILNEFFADVTPNTHKIRRRSLQGMITDLNSGVSLSVISLNRNTNSNTTKKHQIETGTHICSHIHLHLGCFNLHYDLL